MAHQRVHFFQVLVYMAYGYFLLFFLAWFLVSLGNNHRFNYIAFTLAAAFGAIAYFRKPMANLIAGLIFLFISIYWLLETLSGIKPGPMDALDRIFISLPAIMLVMSGILVFSYMRLNFKE